jgi:hypothetical protein
MVKPIDFIGFITVIITLISTIFVFLIPSEPLYLLVSLTCGWAAGYWILYSFER